MIACRAGWSAGDIFFLGGKNFAPSPRLDSRPCFQHQREQWNQNLKPPTRTWRRRRVQHASNPSKSEKT